MLGLKFSNLFTKLLLFVNLFKVVLFIWMFCLSSKSIKFNWSCIIFCDIFVLIIHLQYKSLKYFNVCVFKGGFNVFHSFVALSKPPQPFKGPIN